MAKARAKIRRGQARKLLLSQEVADDLLARAERIRSAAGEGFAADVQPGKNRARAMVKTANFRARREQAANNTLLKALDAGR